jgi:hypothetical protein
MPSYLTKHPEVSFIARKNFTMSGEQFKTGDDVPQMNDHPRLEVFVRNGYVIPVVESTDQLPYYQFRHTAMTRAQAMFKIGLGPKPSNDETLNLKGADPSEAPSPASDDSEPFDPGQYKIEEVLAYVGDDPQKAETVWGLEVDGKGRPTLLDKLSAITTEESDG